MGWCFEFENFVKEKKIEFFKITKQKTPFSFLIHFNSLIFLISFLTCITVKQTSLVSSPKYYDNFT